jgi:hypothetical protein
MDRAVPPFFLVGNPRSGTKMLRELLNASPDIWISDVESHFVPKFTRVIDRFGDRDGIDARRPLHLVAKLVERYRSVSTMAASTTPRSARSTLSSAAGTRATIRNEEIFFTMAPMLPTSAIVR